MPNALSFFAGSRFVPIISTIVYMFVGIALYFIWPVVQNGIYALGGLVTGSGYFGTLIFGIVKRAEQTATDPTSVDDNMPSKASSDQKDDTSKDSGEKDSDTIELPFVPAE